MKCVVAKSILWLLLPEQKEHCEAVANDLIQTTTHEPDFLKKAIALKGTEASLSYVQCFLYLVSSSTNVSIFDITWLEIFDTISLRWRKLKMTAQRPDTCLHFISF